jgi:hypothetical protein
MSGNGQPREAGLHLAAGLDPGEIAGLILEATVPRFADAVGVYILERLLAGGEPGGGETGGRVVARRLAAGVSEGGHPVPPGAFPAGEVLAFDPAGQFARCLATGEPVVFGPLAGKALECLAGRPGGKATVSQFSSFLAVPMVTGDVTCGLLVFGRRAAEPAFGDGDAAAVAGLAARAGACVVGTVLLMRQRSTMDAFQRALAPRNPPVPPGAEVAGRCLPAAGHSVSGDWYDVVSLPSQRTGLVVGDVMGHGPEAAALMAQLRAAAHALADLDLEPAELLRQLDRTAATLPSVSYATCTYAVLDAAEGSCVVATAGHLPPVLALPGGATRVPRLPSGLPLGLGVAIYGQDRLAVPPGATLALYTDGLVESRSRTSDEGILALRSALPRQHGSLPDACETLIGSLADGGEDDTTLVLARIPAGTRPPPRDAAPLQEPQRVSREHPPP